MKTYNLRTRSGATLQFGNRSVTKCAPDIGLQGQYMRERSYPFVQPRFISANRYSMPRLHTFTDYPGEDISRVLYVAHNHLWKPTGETQADNWRDVHVDYMENLYQRHSLPTSTVNWMRRRLAEYAPTSLAYHIHGDLTLENVCNDMAGSVFFIDPLPNRPYVPQDPIVDKGKLMQSARGWEEVSRRGATHPNPVDRHARMRALTAAMSNTEQRACEYWYAVHCVRLLRYVSGKLVNFYMGELRELTVSK